LVAAYQSRVRQNYAQLALTVRSLLGDGEWEYRARADN